MKRLTRLGVPTRPRTCQYSRHVSFATRSPTRLDLQSIDAKWRARWDRSRNEQHASQVSHEKGVYILSMFPYPSGNLHMGHLRVYTISDVIARFKRMKGYNVLHPMGWDAFGLPAENAAVERGIDPREWTHTNIARMKEQLVAMNAHFDWDRELMTCSPSFYKHTQRIFLLLHEKGLAYQSEALVNYDPVDKTVLANEQVDGNGLSWRSGAKVEKLKLKQWFFRITAFKEALLQDLDTLAQGHLWPDHVLSMQRHWLGKSTGARIKFQVHDGTDLRNEIEVFTTRPDTLFGVQYLALSTTHPIVQELSKGSSALREFLASAPSLGPESKAGFELHGLSARNPLTFLPGLQNGETASVPIYVAPYVLGDYGEGAVMGVPGHDTRDLAFWRQHTQDVPLTVVEPSTGSKESTSASSETFVQVGVLNSKCGPYAGLTSIEAGHRIVSDLQECGGRSQPAESWRLRDWLVSRQRYWGTPIPIIHCPSCGPIPVPVDQLPVILPELSEHNLKGKPGNPLEHIASWVNTTCPRCGGASKRETDTMDTFVDSSWYYMRFPDSHNEDQPFSQQSALAFLPVDTYIGGVEHAILHLLYSRFIYKFLAISGLFAPPASQNISQPTEPFRKLVTQGMVHGKTYSDPATGRFLKPSDISEVKSVPIITTTGTQPAISWEKMSKSKHNGVDPTTCVTQYGADAVRAHVLFAAPVGEVLDWDEEKIVGIQRWFQRTFRLVEKLRKYFADCSMPSDLLAEDQIPLLLTNPETLTEEMIELCLSTNATIIGVTETMDNDVYALNTSISDLIKLTNKLNRLNLDTNAIKPWPWAEAPPLHKLSYLCLNVLLRMMAPVAPAFAEEGWERLHQDLLDHHLVEQTCGAGQVRTPSILDEPFPMPFADTAMIARLKATRQLKTCAVQINGKLRFTTKIPAWKGSPALEEYVVEQLLETTEGQLWLRQKNDWSRRKRVIVVGKGKVVNIVF